MSFGPRSQDYRLRAGTFTSSGLAIGTYGIENFPVQSDQQQDNQTVVPWAAPFQCPVPEYAEIFQTADGTEKTNGFIKGILGPFKLWTFGMFAYVQGQIWPGGIRSALVTMLLHDKDDSNFFINATAYLPVEGQDMTAIFSGYTDVKIRYDIGTKTT